MLKITKSLVLSLSLFAMSSSAYAEDKKVKQYEMQSPPAKTQSAPTAASQMPVGEPIKVEGPRAAQLLRQGASEEVKIDAYESGPDPLFIGIFSLLNTLVPFAALVAVVCGIIIIRGRNKVAEQAKSTVVSDNNNNAASESSPTTEPQPESKS